MAVSTAFMFTKKIKEGGYEMKRFYRMAYLAGFAFLTLSLKPNMAFGQLNPPKEARNLAKPWLGIGIEKGKKGVLVKGVMPNTPAEEAGVLTGDEILSIDKNPVTDPKALIAMIQSAGIGQTVTVEILRGSQKITKQLKLVMRPDELKIIRDKFVGKAAPKFNLDVVHGQQPGSIDKLKGKVVVLEFWATWCPACRATHPRLSEFAGANPGISVLAVSDEETAVLQAYARKLNPKFTILRDPDGKIQGDWMASAIPMTAVIDKSGNVTSITVGAGESLEEALTEAAKLAK